MHRDNKFRTACGLVAAALIAVALGTAGTAAARPAPDAGNAGVAHGAPTLSPDVAATVHGSGADAQERALAAYWTPERMKSAHPDSELVAAWAKAGAAPAAQSTPAAQSAPAGPAARVPAAAPATTPKPTGVTPAAYQPGYPVGHPVARTSGKVFFTSQGLNYVCSGTIVNTEGKSSVWTAGHCVSDGGAWNTNWTFVPNYASGSAPYGYWYAYQLWTTTAWFNNNNDFANDVGSAVMNRNGGQRITDYLGGQGIAWNYPAVYYAYAFGYPQASPFNGCCLYAENGSTVNPGGGVIYMANAMTGGSSGGAWLMSFDGNWGYINGHNDFKYNNQPQLMYSPYYGNQVANLYNTVRNIST